jgi:rRNA-processing protein FCF1
VDIKGKGDAPIFNLAVGRGWPVATSDGRLRNKLHKRGIPVVLVRERGHLELTEP